MARPSALNPGNYHWADYLIYMEAGAMLDEPHALPARRGYGIALCTAIAAAAFAVPYVFTSLGLAGGRLLDPAMTAILLGVLCGNALQIEAITKPGTTWVIKSVLPLGIILLGARLNVFDVLAVGTWAFVLSLGVVAGCGLIFLFLYKVLKLDPKLATLLAVGTSICGGSAIVAVAPVIDADDDTVAVSVSTAVVIGLVAMLALPTLGVVFGLSEVRFGYWSGLAIHQTPQVLAAAFAYGPEAGETATIVKLLRICLLAPAVFVLGASYRTWFAPATEEQTQPPRFRGLVPHFVVGLVVLAVARTLGLFPDITMVLPEILLLDRPSVTFSTAAVAGTFAKVCLVLAMAAVGMQTRAAVLRTTGLRALAAGLIASTIIIAAIILLLPRVA